MNPQTLTKLEFDAIRELIAGYCSCALGKGLARTMKPSTDPRTVKLWLTQVAELLAATDDVGLPPFGGIYDVRDPVRASAFPTPLEPEVLAQVAETLRATGTLSAWLTRAVEKCPSLARLAERIADLTPIADAISEAIDARGAVRDYASEKLASIRKTIERTRGQIKRVMDHMVRQGGVQRMLQYAATTFHNDRMVLPLKAEYRGRINGIIHRTSDSGATLFVEPAESVELNNTIVRLREDESKEITRILRGLSQRVAANAEQILATLDAVAILDLIAAKCRYAKKRACTCPDIDERGVLELHDARHPMLVELFARDAEDGAAEREVVPNDVRLGDDFDILVITGPNTGGKTVVLKTVGALALMTQCGIPIPAGPASRMPVYKSIFIDIGDEQSIQQSLSTFSSHLSNQLAILERSGSKSLVLIDELGAGTDPDEGAAIGRTIVAELLRVRSHAVLTTHLSALKAAAYTTARVDNASVEFDPQSLAPTYRLRLGEPGSSNALIIAKRLGMPQRLVEQARGFLDQTGRTLDRAIAGTQALRREAEAARKAATEASLEAQRRQEQYEKDRQQLVAQQAAFQRWTQWVNALKPGDAVFVRSLHRPATVVRMQLHKQTAVVTSGALDLEIPLRDVAMPAAQQA